ncbi:MAG: BREX system ATP-binding domain-containing protein [Waddliaceae bacterium]
MDRFPIRRAVERLRDGLFDPVAVDRLTVEEEQIKKKFSKGLKALEGGKSEHLCICGSYGQGKSHTLTYLNHQALSEGYATSVVQLDSREVPFHLFSVVYHNIMEKLSLPDGKTLTQAWKQQADKLGALEFLETMPHRFRMILMAMLCKNKQLSPKERSLKKHRNYRPREFGYWLEKALIGHDIPVTHLRNAFSYREIENFRGQSLVCRGNAPYVQMVQSLGRLLKEIGYKGIVLFFDEAESIVQARLGNRVKSYEILDQFFQIHPFVYPIFAFTDDFFDKVNQERYDDSGEMFPKNYAKSWQDLTIMRLQDFSSQGWHSLLDRLIQLYGQAYQIDLPPQMKGTLQALLKTIEGQETRYKLKALVNKLDIEIQQAML